MNRHFKELHSFIENTISKVGYDPELFLEEDNKKKEKRKKGEILNDPVFGKMTFDVLWIKKEKIKFIDKIINFDIACDGTGAWRQDPINNKQQKSYIWFKDHIDEINEKLPDIMIKYIKSIEDDYKPYLDDKDVDQYYKKIVQDMLDPKDKLVKLFNPKQLLIKDDGRTIFLCYTQWDTHGIGIQVYPKYKIDIMDIFL